MNLWMSNLYSFWNKNFRKILTLDTCLPLHILHDSNQFFGLAIILPHFSHFEVSNGSYMGIKTLTLGSREGCSRKILLLKSCSNDHNDNVHFWVLFHEFFKWKIVSQGIKGSCNYYISL
jgi:hypothetical protein